MEYERWKAEVNVRYQRLKEQAQKLVEQARASGEDLKDSMEPHVKQLEAQQKDFEDRLTELQRKGSAGWGALRSGVERSVEELESSYHEAREKMDQK